MWYTVLGGIRDTFEHFRWVSDSFRLISHRASEHFLLLSNFRDEYRGLSLVSLVGLRHQLHLFPLTAQSWSNVTKSLLSRHVTQQLERRVAWQKLARERCWLAVVLDLFLRAYFCVTLFYFKKSYCLATERHAVWSVTMISPRPCRSGFVFRFRLACNKFVSSIFKPAQ